MAPIQSVSPAARPGNYDVCHLVALHGHLSPAAGGRVVY